MHPILHLLAACAGVDEVGPSHPLERPTVDRPTPGDDEPTDTAAPTPTPMLPLEVAAEVALPVDAVGFDYQDVDDAHSHLVIVHADADAVDVVGLDGTLVAEVPGIPKPRGVVVAEDIGTIFVTSSPKSLVMIDSSTSTEVGRVTTGKNPDGVAWDPTDKVVGVSDEGDGALSLLPDAGAGKRVSVPLGAATGNVVYDDARGVFWIAVESGASGLDQLVAVKPLDGSIASTYDLPGCTGAHGLHLHPDAQSAFVACVDNAALLRVDLTTGTIANGTTGTAPDVLATDDVLGWLYVAAESGDLTVFDMTQPGVALVGHDSPGTDSHTVAVDPSTHDVYFPLAVGPDGTAVLRILRPSGL